MIYPCKTVGKIPFQTDFQINHRLQVYNIIQICKLYKLVLHNLLKKEKAEGTILQMPTLSLTNEAERIKYN